MPASPRPDSGAVLPLLAVAGIGGLEALGLLVLAVLVLGASGLFFAACGLGLGWSAWALARRESWSRGPLLVAQLLLLALAWSHRSPYPLAATVIAGLAVIALVLLVLPTTTRALSR